MRSLGPILNLGERSSRRPLQRKGSLSTVFLGERYSEYESGVSTTDHAKADALRNMPFQRHPNHEAPQGDGFRPLVKMGA